MALLPKNASRKRRKLNGLAAKLYKELGFIGPEDWDFEKSENPRENQMWRLAVIAYDHFYKTKVST